MLGYGYIFAFCLCIGFSTVFVQHTAHDNSILVLVGSAMSILFYGALSMRNGGRWWVKLKTNWPAVLGANVATALGWACSYIYGLTYIDAATMLCLYMGSTPIITFLLTTRLRDYRKQYPTMIALLAVVVTMGLIIYEHAYRHTQSEHYIIGGIWAILGGLATAYIGIFSAKLNRNGFSPVETLASRFWFVFIMAFGLALYRGCLDQLSIQNLKTLFVAGLFSNMVTTFLFQNAIKQLGPFVTSMFIPFSPIFAYFFQLYTGTYVFHTYTFILILFCCITICAMNVLMHRGSSR